MTQQSIDFLEQHKHHYDLLVKAQYVQHLDLATRQGILDVIRKEFSPGYLADLWCQTCVADMLRFCYVQYEKWKSENKK